MKKERFHSAILLLIIGGLILRVFVSADFFLHSWDERYHALVAKNLIQHPLMPTLYENPVLSYDYKNWDMNHVWVHKQPLPLWAMSASMSLFGINEIALRLPSILLTTLGIWLTFYLGGYYFNKKAGYIAAFLFSINGLIIELTGGRIATDHVDIFFLIFIELAIVFSVMFAKKQKSIFNVFVGLSLGAAILSKWLPALIVLPIWGLIVIDSNNFKSKQIVYHFAILIIVSIVVFLPWQIYIFQVFPLEAEWEATYNFKHLTEALSDRTGPIYYFLNKIRVNYGELIYLPLVWFLLKTYKNKRNLKDLSLLVWIFIPLLFFSMVKTKMQAYILFTSPALFIVTAAFYQMLLELKKNHKWKWVFTTVMVLLLALPIRYGIERTKFFENRDRNPQWVSDLKELGNENIKKGVLLNYHNNIEAMFYTDLIAYRSIPDKEEVLDLMNRGYTVIVNDKEVPEHIKAIDGVLIRNIEESH